ncbi:polyprenyl synthetase family protein [Nocardia abscessus]|uniref:polyprenyl synthetase family protein n=1 Tax=Nocardia abscessus TaxID=120957 RepID=UPI002453F5AD|nr:polyprenyl synthetase family protein [Nocardia abscessus]
MCSPLLSSPPQISCGATKLADTLRLISGNRAKAGSTCWQAWWNPLVDDQPPAVNPTEVATLVDAVLIRFLDDKDHLSPAFELTYFSDQLRSLLAAGGKRFRPLMCVTGWTAVEGAAPSDIVYRVAASLELFHCFALIHDDVMDHSDTRRGRPTAHHALAARHRDHANPAELGVNAAILLGDLALGWSYDLLVGPPSPTVEQLARMQPTWDALRTETLIGQYLDLAASGRRTPDLDTAWRIIRYKTAKYTIERPLHLGANLAGGTTQQLRALSDYAVPLGEAFQLRDDLLGVFGNPHDTGKSVEDDLRSAKHTVLIATALQRATPTQRRVLDELLGKPDLTEDQYDQIRAVLTATGAVATVEQLIATRCESAAQALHTDHLHPAAVAILHQFAAAATSRAG